jgi:hypothetical protein
MRYAVRSSGAARRAVVAMLLAATVLAMLVAPVGVRSSAAQDLEIQTRVVIVHAAPSLGKVEVHINYDEVADEFVYGDQSDWISFTPGSVRFTITADRAGFNYALFDVIYPVPAGNDYYVVISDALVLTGSFDLSPAADGGARVSVLPGSVALPAVNVTASGVDEPLASALGYARTSEPAVVPAGTYDLQVTLADTGQTALTAPGVALNGNTSNVLVIMGAPNDTDHPLEIRVLSDATQTGTPTA